MLIEEPGSNCGGTHAEMGRAPNTTATSTLYSAHNVITERRCGAQPREKRINQISTTGGAKNKYQYPQNRDKQALTVTLIPLK